MTSQQFLDSLKVPDLYSDPASANWVNPYYTGPATGYHRFNPDEVGAGLTHSGNSLVSLFDRAIASQWTKPLDLTPYYGSEKNQSAAEHNLGGGNPFVRPEQFKEMGLFGSDDPRLQAAIDYNNTLKGDQARYRSYISDPAYGSGFTNQGIDISSLNSPAALAALGPDQKAGVYDIAARERQFKNQRAKSGILDSLPGQLLLGAATGGVGSALGLGAAGIGALTGGVKSLSQGGSFGDILKGAAIGGAGGYAGGKLLNFAKGKLGSLSNPFGSKSSLDLGRSAAGYSPKYLDGFNFGSGDAGGTLVSQFGSGAPNFNTGNFGLFDFPGAAGTASSLGSIPGNIYSPSNPHPSYQGGGNALLDGLARGAGIAGKALGALGAGDSPEGQFGPGAVGGAGIAALPPINAVQEAIGYDYTLPLSLASGGGGSAPQSGALRSGAGAGRLPDEPGRRPGYQPRPFGNYLLRA